MEATDDPTPSPPEPAAPPAADAPAPTLAPPTPLVLATAPATTAFTFHGNAREYFRIWIVNTFLTLITLGVFSAWAKVRKRRYLRGNTELLGHRFDYTADPRRLLIGNLIVVALFLTYALFGAVYPALRILALALGVIFLPWIIVRSLAFNAHNTMWRGLRFRFHPSLSAAVMIYLLKPLLIPLTLGLYYPAWARDAAEFRVSRHRLGTAYFRFHATRGPFYRAHLAAGGIIFVGLLLVGLATQLTVARNAGHVPTTAQLLPALLVYAALLFLAKHYAFARLFNPIWNGTRLDDHRFKANLRSSRWLGLQFTNLGAILISCGLLYPWAVVRTTRYALSCLAFEPAGPIDSISRMGRGGGSAVGDTAAEFAGVDFGL